MNGAVQEWVRDDLDKSGWGAGAWQAEPDKVQWVDEATGLDCLIVRGPAGALCGYVGIPPEHPWHGKDYSQCVTGCGKDWCGHTPEGLVRVHGGLTFSDACSESEDPARGICHVPLPGRPDDVWWFGFDCAHSGDACPAHHDIGLLRDGVYRRRSYVESEVRGLALQLSRVVEIAPEAVAR